MVSTGPGKLKSKPNIVIISSSSSIRAYLDTCLYSSFVNRPIIRLNDGDVSYSSFADINIEMVAKSTYLLSGMVQWPTILRYRSKIF